MANYLDYLRWRGDLSFSKKKFNEIDAAIFAALAYLPFNEIKKRNKTLTLANAAQKLLELDPPEFNAEPSLKITLQLIIKSPRFAKVTVEDVVSKTTTEPAMQFMAVTFHYQKNSSLVAYRGTDHSMIGWNEDMTMSYADKIEGQDTAVDYLEGVMKQFPTYRFKIVGHSKGGNFAIYAGAFAQPTSQDRIDAVFNFDGPGFVRDIYLQPSFQNIIPKLHSFVPQGSIFGLMLEHPEPLKIVRSSAKMLLQHTPVTWDVVRDYFIKVDVFSKGSNIIDQAIKTWIEEVSPDQREQLWSALFEALDEINITDVDQLLSNKIVGLTKFSKVYSSLSPENRQIAGKIIEELIQNVRKNYNINIPGI